MVSGWKAVRADERHGYAPRIVTHTPATDTQAASTNLSPGKAKITIIKKGAKHPYHLIYQNWAETHVYGWVDEGTFSK